MTVMQADQLTDRADALRSARTPFVLATVVRVERPTSAKPGDTALVLPDGTLVGFVGGSCAESTVRLHGLRLLDTGASTLLRITPGTGEETSAEGLVTVANPCLSGGTMDIFLEAMLPPVLLHVLGDAPVARALERLGGELGYEVTRTADPNAVIAPDTSAVVVATHGRDEEPVLTAALRAGVPYIGLVASERRGSGVLAGMALDDEDHARVHTPAGLAIGARTAPEVALAIMAELVSLHPTPVHRGAMGAPDEAVATGGDASGTALDPVCGMRVAVAPATVRYEHDGVTWYFCGTGCRQAFADDPLGYQR